MKLIVLLRYCESKRLVFSLSDLVEGTFAPIPNIYSTRCVMLQYPVSKTKFQPTFLDKISRIFGDYSR